MRTPGEQPPAGGGSGGTGPESAAGDPDEVGRLLAGRYRVTGRIGRGGMGMVWRAADEVLGRQVAVKELRTFTDAAPEELEELRTRMQREARAAARVRHEGVVAVHDVTQHEGRPVIVMELIEGPSLDDVLRERGTVAPREAAAVGAKVMDALAAAHRAGVLHRDVKPGNVLLENGTDRVVLTDFGIAAVEDPDDGANTRLTGSGELVGSLDYLAPERARGEAPSAACDVWALGATLYAAVEGSVPFRRTSTWSTLNAIVVEPLPEPRHAGPLGPVLAELMAKDPAQRAGAERAKALLESVAQGESPAAGASSTMRLGTPGRPQPERGASPEQAHGQPEFAGQQSRQPDAQGESAPHPARFPDHVYAAAPSGSGPVGKRGTDRHTVRTGAVRGDGRRKALVAAAVAAVVLTGAGAAYAAVAGGDGGGPRAGGSHGSGTPGAGEPGPGKHGDSVPEKDGRAGRTIAGAGGKPGGTEGRRGDKNGDGGTNDRAGNGADGPGDGGSGSAASGGSGAAGGSSGTGGGKGGNGGAPAPDPACHPRGGGKFDCTVWKAATSFDSGHKPVGRLNAGTNYFFCQKKLRHRETEGRWTNVWWAKTDDDKGNKNVFVSDVYLKGGKNDSPVPGLPVC